MHVWHAELSTHPAGVIVISRTRNITEAVEELRRVDPHSMVGSVRYLGQIINIEAAELEAPHD